MNVEFMLGLVIGLCVVLLISLINHWKSSFREAYYKAKLRSRMTDAEYLKVMDVERMSIFKMFRG